MGHDAAVTKRIVLDKVEQCVDATNVNIRETTALAAQHNAFTEEMGTRLTAQGAWIEAVERQVVALAETCGRDASDVANRQDAIAGHLEKIDDATGRAMTRLLRDLVELQDAIAEGQRYGEQLREMGILRRFWWLLTGHLPSPALRNQAGALIDGATEVPQRMGAVGQPVEFRA